MKNNNWEWKKLGEVCDVKKGTSITKARVINGDVPVIAGGQQPAYFHNVSNREGSVITISASGAYAGFINYFETPIFASDCTTIQSNDKNKFLTRFIYLMLKSQQKKVYDLQTGAGQPHVYAKDLIKIEIPIPPLPTQQKIVSILERAERLKQKRERANEEANKIIQSVFYKLFGNSDKTQHKILEFKKLVHEFRYGTSVKSSNDGELPVLRIPNIVSENINLTDLKRVSLDKKERYRILLKKGDILFVRTNGNPNYVGRSAVFNLEGEFVYASYLIKASLKKDLVNPIYLVNFLRLPSEQAKVRQKCRTSAGQFNINTEGLGSLHIVLPPISLQNQFASIVEKIESIKQKQNQATSEINTLFDALMQKAFNGELII